MVARAPTLALPGIPLEQDAEFTRQLYVGAPGSGKTTALAHMAHLGNIVILKAEAGLKYRRLQALGVPVENIRVLPARTYEEMDKSFWLIKGALEDDPTSIVGVGWDSISEIGMRFHAIARNEDWEDYQARNQGMALEHGEFFTDRAVWGEVSGQIGKLLTKYGDLPCHFVVTALPRRDEDQNEGTVTYNPAVQPALITPLTGMMDLIGKFEAIGTTPERNEIVRGTFRGGGAWNVKDRDGMLPPMLWYPTFDRIFDYIEGRITEETDPVQAQYDQMATAGEMQASASALAQPIRRRRTSADGTKAAPAAAESE